MLGWNVELLYHVDVVRHFTKELSSVCISVRNVLSLDLLDNFSDLELTTIQALLPFFYFLPGNHIDIEFLLLRLELIESPWCLDVMG